VRFDFGPPDILEVIRRPLLRSHWHNVSAVLHFAALKPREILYAARCGFERVMNDQPEIVMRLDLCDLSGQLRSGFSGSARGRRLPGDDEFLTRQRKVDANVTLLPFPVVPMRKFNSHTAVDDLRVEGLQLFCLLADPLFYDW